jgi:uncharacterized protein (TIGR03086 family)
MADVERSPADDAIAAMALFGEVLSQVDDSHLELDTPCPDWDVETLISHVVLGDAGVPLLFAGEPLDGKETIDRSILGPNPMSTWRGTALAAIEALRAPGAMDQIVHHPTGDRPGSTVARFRLVDVLAHTWDLATAASIPFEIPDELAEAALDFLFPMVDLLRDSEYFGSSIEPPADARAGVRFLALVGRAA